MARRRPKSTEREPATGLGGWPLEDLPPETIDELCEHHGVTERGARRLEALRQRLADPDRLREHLATLSPFELVLLEALVDHGGSSRVDWLWDEACRRVGIDRGFHRCEIDRAVDAIGCGLRTEAGDRLSAVFDVCLPPLRGLLSGVSMPAPCEQVPEQAVDEARRVRDVIIAAARTAHRRVRQNKDGSANRANRRKFEDGVASATGSPWEALELAIDAELVAGDASGALVPNLPRLATVATAGLVSRGRLADETAISGMLAAGVVGIESFVRAEQRRRTGHGASPARMLAIEPGGWSAQARARSELSDLVGVWMGTVDGAQVAALARPGGRGGGHVLPNFEVMLQPDADLELVRVVALAAEAVRLDRLCTFRLTPAALRGALRSGVTLEEIEDALARVGPREVPENVLQSLRDWAGQVNCGRVVTGRVVVVDADVADGLLADASLGEGLQALAPGVLHVAAAITDQRLYARLDELGVVVATVRPPEDGDRPPRWTMLGSLQPFVPGDSLDEHTRARVTAAMAASEFPPLVHDEASDHSAVSGYEAPPGVDQRAFDAEIARVRDELRRWHGKLKIHARRKLSLESLLDDEAVPMLAMAAPEDRARIYKRATKLAQLRRRAVAAMTAGLLSTLAEADNPLTAPVQFPDMAPIEVRHALNLAIAGELVIELRLVQRGREQITPPLVIERIEPRGRELVVLAHDEADQAYAYPLTQVASVRDADGASATLRDTELVGLLESLSDRLGRRR